jgi:hypothetical protein
MTTIPKKWRERILSRLYDATTWIECFSEADGACIAQEIIDDIVKALRRDPRWAVIPRLELEALLGDARHHIGDKLFEQVGGHSPYRDTLRAIADDLASAQTRHAFNQFRDDVARRAARSSPPTASTTGDRT